MWDLDTLNYMNEQEEHRYAQEMVKRYLDKRPLVALTGILKYHLPPSITSLLSMLRDREYYLNFIKLVKDLLPEREKDIFRETNISRRLAAFASYFEDRYFPIDPSFRGEDMESYYDLVNKMPLIPLGFGYEDYDNLIQDGYSGYRLMTFLFEHPYGEDGDRVALGEACQEHVPAELLKRIPEKGFSREEIHRLLDGTGYKALGMWGDYIECSTGNNFLDIDREMMDNSVPPDWSTENVAFFTREWKKAERHRQQTGNLAAKFDKDPAAFLKKVLDSIDERKELMHGTNTGKGADRVPVGTT